MTFPWMPPPKVGPPPMSSPSVYLPVCLMCLPVCLSVALSLIWLWPGGKTPIYWAAKHGHVEVVKVLLDAGADPYKAADDGMVALDIARENGHEECVKALQVQVSPQQ